MLKTDLRAQSIKDPRESAHCPSSVQPRPRAAAAHALSAGLVHKAQGKIVSIGVSVIRVKVEGV